MRDPIFIEMFDCDEPTPARAYPAQSPLDCEMFPFEKSTGAAELLAAKLEHRHFVAEMLGTSVFEKRIPPGLFDITPGAGRPPISTNTFEQQPLPEPAEDDETGVRLCDCECARCQKDECKSCCAESKCPGHPSRAEAHKAAIARICGEAKGRLHAYVGSDRASWDRAWQGVEGSMVRFVADAIASAV
jgi:hypothetical protein